MIFSRLPVVLMFYMSHLYHCDKQYSIKGSVANAPANFKTVTWTIPFIRNQWFLKHDWIKLHYSQLPTTSETSNGKRQRKTYPTVWIEEVQEMQQRNDHSTTNCITLLFFSRENFYGRKRTKPNLQINHWPLNLL